MVKMPRAENLIGPASVATITWSDVVLADAASARPASESPKVVDTTARGIRQARIRF